MTSCISPNGTAFDLHGPADGAVVVLIHGLGLTRDTWAYHVPALAQRYRVLSYDLAGHGDSAKPMKRPSLSLFSDQLREFAIRGRSISTNLPVGENYFSRKARRKLSAIGANR